jgi:hypothetical protein
MTDHDATGAAGRLDEMAAGCGITHYSGAE